MSEQHQIANQQQQKIPASSVSSYGTSSLRHAAVNSVLDRPMQENMIQRNSLFEYEFSSIPVYSPVPSRKSADWKEDIFNPPIQWNAAGPESETTQEGAEEMDEEANEETDEQVGEEAQQESEQPTVAGKNNGELPAKNAPDSLPAKAVGGLVKGKKKVAHVAKLIIKTIPKLWFFNKETPPSYTVSTTVSTNKTGGVFNWTVSPTLQLSAANIAAPVVTTLAESSAKGDSWIRVQHTDVKGSKSDAVEKLTIRAPHDLKHIKNTDKADATWGYDCEIHYSIRDQFGKNLPRNVPINEQWSGGVTADFPGMDWRRGAEGSATGNPSNWFDHIQGETAGRTPAPVAPGAAGAGTAVYHWPGDWRVGSLTIGKGSRVASITWQKNRGFARHT